MNKTRPRAYVLKIFKSKTIWIKILIFSIPKIIHCFISFFLFYFGPPVFILLSFWLISYSQSYFSSVQSAVRPNHAFGPPTQFPLVIFDLRMPAAAFGLPDRRTALHCVVRLRHRGAGSSAPPLPIWKWLHPIAFPFPFPPPVPALLKFHCPASLPLIARLPSPYNLIKGVMRAPPSLHQSTTGRLY
jgi:hypothetical protein